MSATLTTFEVGRFVKVAVKSLTTSEARRFLAPVEGSPAREAVSGWKAPADTPPTNSVVVQDAFATNTGEDNSVSSSALAVRNMKGA